MAGRQNIIAFIWDFDKTLIPEYMEDPIFKYYKIDGKQFWDEVNHLPHLYREQGIEHIAKDTLYLNHILTYIQKNIFKGLNNKLLRQLGKKIIFNKGIPDFFERVKQYVSDNPLYRQYNITIEHYIVSTGLKEMIAGSKIASSVDGIWANEFIEHIPQPHFLEKKLKVKKSHVLSQVAYTMDNTTKTRALFEINKGSNKLRDGDVNALLPEAARRVPFSQMIYIADGPSDIPCFSIMNKFGGKSFVVYKPGSQINFMQAVELFKQKRVNMLGEANFEKGSQTYMSLISIVDDIAQAIITNLNPHINFAPKRLGHIYHERHVHDEKYDET